MRNLNRRQFLALGGSGLSWLALRSLPPVQPAPTRRALREMLAGVIADPAAAEVLGRSYLARHGDLGGVQGFARQLQQLYGRGDTDHEAILTFLRERCEDDFRCHDSVIVENWLLARSEARLFALYTLSA